MTKVICIHPKDKTTDFLCPIHKVLQEKGVILYYGDTNDITFKEWKKENCKDVDILIFLGHGASNCLYGSPIDNSEPKVLFSIDDLKKISCNVMYLLSCRSNELLDDNIIVSKYVGFPIMYTSMEDLRGEQLYNDCFYMNLNEHDINLYNKILVKSFCYALSSSSLGDTKSFCYEFILYVNRCTYRLLHKNKSYQNRWDIAELLYDLKENIYVK